MTRECVLAQLIYIFVSLILQTFWWYSGGEYPVGPPVRGHYPHPRHHTQEQEGKEQHDPPHKPLILRREDIGFEKRVVLR